MNRRRSIAVALAVTALGGLVGCTPAASAPAAAEHQVKSAFSQELHDRLPADIRDGGVITVMGDVNPPWRIPGEDGKFTGFQADLLAEFEQILGVDFEPRSAADVASVKLGVQSGRGDIGFGPLLSNEKTRQELIFIDYTVGRASFLSAADGPAATSILDLCGKKVSIPDGTPVFDPVFANTRAACAAAGKADPEVVPLTDNDAVILALRSGRADFAGMSVHQAAFADRQNPGEFQFYVTSDEESPADALGMGFAADRADLAEVILAAWQEVFDDGVYADLMKEYNMSEIAVDKPVLHLDAAKG